VKYKEISEACWTGYQQQGMKKKGNRQVPNCVPVDEVKTGPEITGRDLLFKAAAMAMRDASHEGISLDYEQAIRQASKIYGIPYRPSELPKLLAQRAEIDRQLALLKQGKQVAKQRRREKLAPTPAGAEEYWKSHALPTDRIKPASKTLEAIEEDLKKWFKEKWVRFGPDGKIRGDCARGSSKEGKPKCLPQSKAHALGKKGRASAAAKKRREDPNPERRGAAKNVATRVKETVTDVRAGMAEIYRRLAPKIERHRDSFLAGQLYDELENYAELHGAEREFKQMMNGARNRAHMEYDTNPGGFHNWFWFLPFADEQLDEISRRDFLKGAGATAGLAALGAPKTANAQEVAKWSNYASKLALDSVGNVFDQNWDLRNWIAQNVSTWISNYCDQTNSYNAKNVIDYCNETALNASGFKDVNPILRGFGVYDLKRRANDFLTTYRAAVIEKTSEFNRAVQQQKQQATPIAQEDMQKLAAGILLYIYAKEDGNEKLSSLINQILSKIIKAYNNKDQINAIYRGIYERHNETKPQDPAMADRVKKSIVTKANAIVNDLNSVAVRGGAEEFKEESVNGATDDIKKRISKLEALALAANRAGDDAKCKMYQQKIQSLKQKLSQSMAEGWSDAIVSRRTGRPRTPYSVYIKGKKWKDFENDDHARAVMDKLKAKFKADGRDPSVITIAPTDIPEGVAEAVTIDRNRVPDYPRDPATVAHRTDTAKAILSDPRSDTDSRREASAILAALKQVDEEQDACYRKVKSRYKVWPSAYASGALVQCRKKGAANWGNKTKK